MNLTRRRFLQAAAGTLFVAPAIVTEVMKVWVPPPVFTVEWNSEGVFVSGEVGGEPAFSPAFRTNYGVTIDANGRSVQEVYEDVKRYVRDADDAIWSAYADNTTTLSSIVTYDKDGTITKIWR